MFTTQGRAKVMDFGLATRAHAGGEEALTVAEPRLTGTGVIVGTPDYMSPEQLTGATLDARSDLFTLGIIAAELLIGRHPFHRGTQPDTIRAILGEPPSLESLNRNDVPPGLIVLIRRLLAKSPAERYTSVSELRADLAMLADASAVDPGPRTHAVLSLIGRDAERDQLLRHLHSALAGRGSLVLIGGEPGIGKTHLTRTIVQEAARRGCFGAVGHCYEMEGSPPYMPFIETLEYVSRVAPRETFRHSIGESASEIAKLMPELRRLYPDIPAPMELPPEQQRRSLFNGYRNFVERATRVAPCVVVFEDLHWADEATLLLLRHLAIGVSDFPLLMIGTYRDAELDVTRPFAGALENWIREKLATRIALRRLPLPSVQAMLTALSGHKSSDSVAATIFSETEGNPFFVEEVYQHLSEEGKLFDGAGNWRTGLRADELEVPQGVRLVIGRRLERLRADTRRTLCTAAVVGRSFDLRLLEALEPADPEAALDAIEEAERARLVELDRIGRDIRYRFVHELVRQTLAETLSLPRRQRLHLRIANALQQRYPDGQVAAIAHHLYQAGAAADLDITVEYLLRATRLANTGAAHEEALANADKALGLLEGMDDRRIADLSFARATALRSLGRANEAVASYERAAALFVAHDNLPAAVDAYLSLAYIHLWNADGERGAPVVEQALQLIRPEPSPLLHHLLLLKSTSSAVSGDMAGTVSALTEASQIEAALPADDSDAIATMLKARVHFQLAQIQTAETLGREAVRRFRATGDRWGESEVMEVVMGPLWLGRVHHLGPLLQDMTERAERAGHWCALWAYKDFYAQMLVALGQLEEAQAALDAANRTAATAPVGWNLQVVGGVISHYRGQHDEAVQHLRRRCEVEPTTFLSGQLSGALFLALAAKGDPDVDAALDKARRFLPVVGRPLSVGSCACLAMVLEALAILGRRSEAATLEPLAEYVAENGPLCLYSQHLFRTAAGIAAAAAGNWARAEEHFLTAIQQADSAPYRTAQPIARYWYADMLLLRDQPGDRDRAREMLKASQELCQTIGMPWYAEGAEKLMRGHDL
jgi:tetratricopeptide (TPR) repeat protein